MEQETVALIQQLAAKLGTTSEYLWAVLIRQAPISAAIGFAQYIAIAVAVYFYVRIVWGNDLDDGPALVAVVVGIILGILSIVAFFSIGSSIAALANPEYWALEKVFHAIKK